MNPSNMKLSKKTQAIIKDCQEKDKYGKLTLKEIKATLEPLLFEVNLQVKEISKKHHKKFIPFTYRELLRIKL